MRGLDAVNWESFLVWGTVATVAMTTILEGARRLRWSRMSLPLIFGAALTGNYNWMSAVGIVAYFIGALIFAFLYAWFFEIVGFATWWLGLIVGLFHGAWLLVVFLPILADIHPRMANARTGPTQLKRLEPPGIAGLHYGLRTPIVTLVGQAAFGLILGIGYHV